MPTAPAIPFAFAARIAMGEAWEPVHTGGNIWVMQLRWHGFRAWITDMDGDMPTDDGDALVAIYPDKTGEDWSAYPLDDGIMPLADAFVFVAAHRTP